jgi:Protein of unknown function (DUF1360)
VTQAVEQAVEDYANDERPLGPYLGLAGVFAGMFGALLFAAERSNRLPARLAVGDLALIGVATHKLTRLLTKDKVTSFLRAPFTEYQKPSGHGEVEEKPRGHGWRLAVGELIVCPYCLGLWVAGAFTTGIVFAPRSARIVASAFAILAVSDFLQLAYNAAEDRSQST